MAQVGINERVGERGVEEKGNFLDRIFLIPGKAQPGAHAELEIVAGEPRRIRREERRELFAPVQIAGLRGLRGNREAAQDSLWIDIERKADDFFREDLLEPLRRGGIGENFVIGFRVLDRALRADRRGRHWQRGGRGRRGESGTLGRELRLSGRSQRRRRRKSPAGLEILAEKPAAERIKFELAEERFQRLVIARAYEQLVRLERDRRGRVDGDEPFRQKRLLAEFHQRFAQLALLLRRMVERVFQRAVLRDELERGLGADARHARDVVRRVAGKTEDVAHLVDVRDAPFRQHLRDAERLRVIAHARGPVLQDVLADELPEILVGRHHVGGETGFFRLARERADQVVGLVAIQLEDREVERADHALDVGQRLAELLRHRVALRLVGLEFLVPRGRRVGVENDREVGRVEAVEQVEQRVGEAVDARGDAAGRRADRVGREREMGAVGQRHAVQKKKCVVAIGAHGRSRRRR